MCILKNPQSTIEGVPEKHFCECPEHCEKFPIFGVCLIHPKTRKEATIEREFISHWITKSPLRVWLCSDCDRHC